MEEMRRSSPLQLRNTVGFLVEDYPNEPGAEPLFVRPVGRQSVEDEFRSRMVALIPRLRRFAVALTGDLDQADDLVQETCARALSRVAQWQEGTRLDSWMYRIAQNLWLDRMRSKKARGEHIPLEVDDIPGADGRIVVESRFSLAAVSTAMATLPQDYRVLIALVCIDGLSYKEAAKITGTPIGTVMSRLARARRHLHACFDDQPTLSVLKSG
jgi:RNA polymerase sigma-70 factor, ECF subfamily